MRDGSKAVSCSSARLETLSLEENVSHFGQPRGGGQGCRGSSVTSALGSGSFWAALDSSLRYGSCLAAKAGGGGIPGCPGEICG